jgi:hypothetical protein
LPKTAVDSRSLNSFVKARSRVLNFKLFHSKRFFEEERPVKGKLNIDERLRKDLKSGKIIPFLKKNSRNF